MSMELPWPVCFFFTRVIGWALAGLEQVQAGQVGTLERLLWSLPCSLLLSRPSRNVTRMTAYAVAFALCPP